MENYKKTDKGIKKRLKLLRSYVRFEQDPLEFGLEKFSRKEAAIDDILDAWVLAISASRGKKKLEYLPKNYEYDSEGLPMRIAKPIY